MMPIPSPSLVISLVISPVGFRKKVDGDRYECVGDRILHTICCSRTMDLRLHIGVHARKKSFLRHTRIVSTHFLARHFPAKDESKNKRRSEEADCISGNTGCGV